MFFYTCQKLYITTDSFGVNEITSSSVPRPL